MERVHYYQEQSLPELKAFAHKGIFSKAEIRKILKKRTEFESALIRRVAKKGDYLRYAAYEMSLEALRRKRLKTLNLPPSPPSAADFALVRRQFYILERAVRKFKADIGLWVQYIDVAKREGARALVGRICARALQLHPNEPALYILSSSHELSQLSPTAARALLQRGLRINAESIELWTEYLKMELGYVETLRRRWEVLGISQKEPQPQDDLEASESARKQIMDGAIAKTVIANAVKAIPKIPLFTLLQKLLSTYPTPLRALLLAELHDHLHRVLPSDPHARLLHATRSLTEALEGEELVDRLKEANQDLVAAVREAQDGRMADLYATWVRERVEQIDETNLRLYLLHSLHAIPASLPEEKLSPGLLSTHLDLLISPAHPSPPSPEKVLKLARKYTSQIPSSAAIWVARLKVEKQLATPEATRTAWAQAREHADGEGVEDVWLWGLADLHAEDVEDTFATVLKTSMRHKSPTLHTILLTRYLGHLHPPGSPPDAVTRRKNMVKILGSYMPTAAFFAAAFDHEAELPEPAAGPLEVIYERWKGFEGHAGDAGLRWAGWLVENGDGVRANEVMNRTRSMVDERVRGELDLRWKGILDGLEADADGAEARELDADADAPMFTIDDMPGFMDVDVEMGSDGPHDTA